MVDTVTSWCGANKKYVIAALGTFAIGITAVVLSPEGERKETDRKVEQPADPAKAKQKEAPASSPAAGAPKAEVAPGALAPNYAESAWYKQLDADVQPVVDRILKTESAKEFAMPFFRFIKVKGQDRDIEITPESQAAIFKSLDEKFGNMNLLNTAVMTNEMEMTECDVTAKDATTSSVETCNVTKQVHELRNAIVKGRVRALEQGEWQEKTPPRLFAERNISESYRAFRDELIKKANDSLKK